MAERTAAWLLAERFSRIIPTLRSQSLRMAFLTVELQNVDAKVAAGALHLVCNRANNADDSAKDVLLTFTFLLLDPELQQVFETIHLCAQRQSFHALDLRLKNSKQSSTTPLAGALAEHERRVPDYYGRGRPLTLGERKSIARKPSRRLFDKLLSDPHPSVIQNLLSNSVTTEDDIVRLAAKRSLPSEVMAKVARHPRWSPRRRVRLALVLNPSCPPEIGVPLVGLLLRSDLRTVIQQTSTQPEIRNAAARRLASL